MNNACQPQSNKPLIDKLEINQLAEAELETVGWSAAALAKFRNIPYFVRSQARKQIEQIAHSENASVITAKIVERAKVEFGQ
jgi:Proto-chlorophyllide reductase 57 kD subunit